jgi:uncharacterized protein (DUF433 family)
MNMTSLNLQHLAHPIRTDANGVARIGDTRVTLETVIGKFLMGDSAEEIADAYLLDLSHVYATISYYLQNRAEVDAYLREGEAEERRILQLIEDRSKSSALRNKLLSRLAASSRSG